jgi:hypothetical protein
MTAVSADYCNRMREQAWAVAVAVRPPVALSMRLGGR